MFDSACPKPRAGSKAGFARAVLGRDSKFEYSYGFGTLEKFCRDSPAKFDEASEFVFGVGFSGQLWVVGP